MKTKTRHEQHFVVIYDTETRKWYMASAGDFLPEGYIWDKDQCNWIEEWIEEYEQEYDKNCRLLLDTLTDFNIFADTYRALDEEPEV